MLLQEQCADAVDGGCEHGEDEQDVAASAGEGKSVKRHLQRRGQVLH